MSQPRTRRHLVAVALASLLAVAAASCGDPGSPAADPPSRAPSATVEYAAGLSEDLYLPAGKARGPLVVMVPGGGWVTADPTGLAGLAASLADDGVATATTHIRAAQDGVTYPVPVEDVLCAVATAVAESGARGFRADPVAVLGHSSGAHLAALAVLAYDDYAPSCGARPVEPDALVGLSGPYDIAEVPALATALMGAGPDEDPGGWLAANPVRRAALRPDVPVLLLHGDADAMVPVAFTTEFADALETAGHPTTVEIVSGADHESIFGADVAAGPIRTWLTAGPAAGG